MIKVRRLDCPDILKTDLPDMSEGESETLDAIVFFQNPDNKLEPYRKMGKRGVRIDASYSVYSNKIIRELLAKMFYGKCAYCESRMLAIYGGDIEHFRPKAAFCNERGLPLTTPGYYWLAANWDNLLFACPFCNQTHSHKIIYKTLADGTVKKETEEFVQGKLNQFPLLTESSRLANKPYDLLFNDPVSYKKAFDEEESQRLLLKPCTDENIEAFFKYSDEGVILVGDNLTTIQRKKAETSIKVYALQRLGLVLEREAKVIQVKAQIRRVENAIKNLITHFKSSIEERTWFEGILRKEMEILQQFKNPDQEYAGLARYIIRRYFEDIIKENPTETP